MVKRSVEAKKTAKVDRLLKKYRLTREQFPEGSTNERIEEFLLEREPPEDSIYGNKPALDFEGISDEAFLLGFRDDEDQPGSVRLSAQKELSRLKSTAEAVAREAALQKEWKPSGEAALLAHAIADVIKVQDLATQEELKKLIL